VICPTCESEQPDLHRYCYMCGEHLVGHVAPERKTTQLFMGFPSRDNDAHDAVLRVSRYPDAVLPQPDGSVRLVRSHARISIWEVDRPVCAISLSEGEVERLIAYLEKSQMTGRAARDTR